MKNCSVKSVSLLIFIILFSCQSAQSNAKAEKPQKVPRIVYEIYSNDWYKTQAVLWKKEIEKNPQNNQAWYNFYNANRYARFEEVDNKDRQEKLDKILAFSPRVEDIAVKDVILRTFITKDSGRNDLVGHVYDITYGVVRDGVDNLVVIDDSIVRGTTLKQSIIRILDRLGPKKIIIASSAPQIRYPDCYGIDMARLNDFVAFKAAIMLLKENQMEEVINRVYKKCKDQQHLPKEQIVNYVKEIYKPFTAQQISSKIAQIVTAPDINAEVQVIYQSIENLHQAIPNHSGDWYFTGDYPTPGGNKVVNQSFINYIEGRNERAY